MAQDASDSRASAPPPGDVRVVVVDDHLDTADMMAAALELEGYEARVANSIPGTMSRNLIAMLPGVRITAGGIEYGTHDVNSVLKSIRADNWLWCHGDPNSAQGKEMRAFMREMFYPAIFEWKIMVLSRSNDVIRQALAGLSRA